MIKGGSFVLQIASAIFPLVLPAQMVSPAIDAGTGPFSYYSQPGAAFSLRWAYSSSSSRGTIDRDGQVLYAFAEAPQHTVRYMLEEDPSSSGILAARVLPAVPTTPFGIVRDKLSLRPRAQVSLDWKLPVIQVAAGSPQDVRIQNTGSDEYLSCTVNVWDQILCEGIDIEVPEAKVNDVFKASLVYDLITRNKIGNDYVQTIRARCCCLEIRRFSPHWMPPAPSIKRAS